MIKKLLNQDKVKSLGRFKIRVLKICKERYQIIRNFKLFLQVSEWGMLYSVGVDQKVSQLTEKDIQSKLDLLFKKNFYDVAIKLEPFSENLVWF